MAKKEEPKNVATDERPNRSAYSQMFSEDYPDVDFEDKESRYGKMVEDRKRLKKYERDGRALSDVFDKNRGLAAMVAAAADGTDPFTWAIENLGVDFREALENEEYAGKCAEALRKFQENQLEGEKSQKARESNLRQSMEALQAVQDKTGISDEECQSLWDKFWGDEGIVASALQGQVSEDTWEAMRKADSYDADIANAREEGGMQARNEKMQNPVKTFDDTKMPPTLGQGSGRASRPKKRESTMDFVKRNM